MHYKNGREAKVGDVVRGKYDGVGHEIIGLLTNTVVSTSDTCNGTVHAVVRGKNFGSSVFIGAEVRDGAFAGVGNGVEVKAIGLTVNLKDFVALDPETGEVLPPA